MSKTIYEWSTYSESYSVEHRIRRLYKDKLSLKFKEVSYLEIGKMPLFLMEFEA